MARPVLLALLASRKQSTLRFSFDLSDGSGSGTVTPSVTAGWS